MARYRQTDTRWIWAACVAGAYLVTVAILFTLQVGEAIVVPIPFAVSAPPLVYAALSIVMLRQASFVRRLSWVGGACVVHVVLGALASLELMWAGGLPATSALVQVFILFAPAPAVTLLATPLLLAVGGLTAAHPAPRENPASRAESATPRAESSTPRQMTTPATARPTPFARSAPARPAAAPAGPTSPATAPAPAPAVGRLSAPTAAMPTPPVTARPSAPAVPAAAAPAPVLPPAVPTPPTLAPTPPPAAAAPVREPRGAEVRKPARQPSSVATADDVMVRVSFARVAPQLPAEAFVLPLERLGESLKEPHALLVPRRVVLAQMREGGIAIDWSTVASQFPDLALGMSDAEFRNRYPDLKLLLPTDEVLPQLPPDTIPLVSAVLNTEGLVTAPTPVVSLPVVAPATVAVAAPVVAIPSAAGRPAVELIDRKTVAGIVACFGGAGTFEAAGERVAGKTFVSLVAPSLPRDAVAACAAGIAGFLTAGPTEVVTVRTTRAVLVLAAAPTAVVVAARRPSAPVALLEMRAARAAVMVGDATATIPPTPGRALKALTVDDRVAGAAHALTSFGGVEPMVFADGAARVYVFSAHGRDATPLGALALGVCEALREGVGELGPLVSVVFRCGSECTLVRPLGSGAVLAAKGKVTRPGRLHRDAERAATILEAL